MTNNFQKSLKKGNKEEIRFANWLLRNNKSVYDFHFKNTGWWDLDVILNNEFVTFEVKADLFSRDERQYKNITVPADPYGTLFIEFNSWGKKSGISTTLADHWVIVMALMDEIWIISTKDLRSIIEQNNFQEKTGGDENKSTGYLIPREKFKNKFKIYKDDEPDYTIRNGFNFQHRLEQGIGLNNEFFAKSEDPRFIPEILKEYYGIYN